MTDRIDETPSDDAEEPGSAIFGVTGTARARLVVGTSSDGVRNYLASQHLWSALRSARLCKKRETELVEAGNINVDIEHRMLAVGAVMSAVAFLEAFVNELFQDAAEAAPGTTTYRTEGLSDDTAALIRQLWISEARLSMLDKFQLGLVCARQPPLVLDAAPYRPAQYLVRLRNALVHFVPETQWSDAEHKLTKQLRSCKGFVMNRQSISEPVYPNRVIAAGCAAWACETATSLVIEWQQRMGLVHDYREYMPGFGPP